MVMWWMAMVWMVMPWMVMVWMVMAWSSGDWSTSAGPSEVGSTVGSVHELSICRSIVDIVAGHAAGRPVSSVRVRVGHLRQVVPTTLAYCWDITVADGPLAGSVLDVDHVPARLRCRACESVTELSLPVLRCAHCDGVDTELLSGEELLVTSFEVRDASDADDPDEPGDTGAGSHGRAADA